MKDLEIGDIFIIPLGNEKYAYGQYVFYDDYRPAGISEYTGHGCMVKIFDLISNGPVNAEEVVKRREMFPPVFTGLTAAIRRKRWKKIGHVSVTDFHYPKFRKTFGHKPGKYFDWKIWNGREMQSIGELPTELRSLEMLTVWGYELLEERIRTGKTGYEEVE